MFRFLRNDTIGMVIYPHSLSIRRNPAFFPKKPILTTPQLKSKKFPSLGGVAKIQTIFDGVVFSIHQKDPLTKKRPYILMTVSFQ